MDIPRPSLIPRLRRALRGDVGVRKLALEAWRRTRAERVRRSERANLDALSSAPVNLREEYARMSGAELLAHFRTRSAPKSLPGCAASTKTSTLQRHLFPFETAQLLEGATRIVDAHSWSLLGYGERCFGNEIDWLRDPLSDRTWNLNYHADVRLIHDDGSDARVLWELNRLSHLLTLARAYAVTSDEKFAAEIFSQLESWRVANPLGKGPNWSCAMEVALRAMNLLVIFELVRGSAQLDENSLAALLKMLSQHGAHIRRNLEFSYISTSNHYLTDVVGLFWLGIILPEIKEAEAWRTFGLREMLNEMDKQVLADGADCEASTGYHRLVLELFLYSFVLARANAVEIHERHWKKLTSMLDYMASYLRPDGKAPLLGDADSGQVLPFCKHAADDHAYILSIGAALFDNWRYKKASGGKTEELLWILGEEGIKAYDDILDLPQKEMSHAFTESGTYIMREDDLYLLFNASGNGLSGRGSHGHNDALSIEVSACGTSFIVDPGTHVYSADLRERHLFRSTAYHSTLQIDNEEQNTTDVSVPFVIGDEAHPKVLTWQSTLDHDTVTARHEGYARLARPITHTRSVTFHKRERMWVVEDTLEGAGEHTFHFRYHFADGLQVTTNGTETAFAQDGLSGAGLFVKLLNKQYQPALEQNFTSRDYGSKSASVSACWTILERAPLFLRWAIIPVCANDDATERLRLIEQYPQKNSVSYATA